MLASMRTRRVAESTAPSTFDLALDVAEFGYRDGLLAAPPSGAGLTSAASCSLSAPSSFEVADLSTLKLKGTLSEQDAALVDQGAAVVIATERGNVEGKITTVLGAVDSATRRVRVEASIDNSKEPKLRAGSFARGTIRAGDPISVLELPPEVLRPGSQDELLVGGRRPPRCRAASPTRSRRTASSWCASASIPRSSRLEPEARARAR